MSEKTLEEYTLSEIIISRIDSNVKRKKSGDLTAYLFGRKELILNTIESINLVVDFLVLNDLNIRKLNLLLSQYGIGNKDEIEKILIDTLESNCYVIDRRGFAVKITNLQKVSNVDGLDKHFIKKIDEIKKGGTVSSKELVSYLEQIRVVLIAKAIGKIKKKKTRVTYSATTDKKGITRKKEALNIIEETENILPTESTISYIKELSSMILELETSNSSSYLTEEELDAIYKESRERAEKQKQLLFEDKRRYE